MARAADMPGWIRAARPADVPHIVRMIRGLATHEGRPELAVCTEAAIASALFGTPARAEAVILLDDSLARDPVGGPPVRHDAIVGYAWFYILVPTFTARPVLYLEDLFVDAAARGRGLGGRFMAWLAAEAIERGCVGVEWTVREDNPRAIAFYESLGAVRKTGALAYRLSDSNLERLAHGASPDTSGPQSVRAELSGTDS
ncbi:MAG: GNAT family N-acetyltransferase [Phycisphaerae bacterium]|nr:GNAT family N-acetyltransferase [Phycisphaerae bacterium]